MQKTTSPVTTMLGGGVYDEGARYQRTSIGQTMALLSRALEECPLPPSGQPFVFVDYGSATGLNSIAPARAVVRAIRNRGGPDVPVSVVHNDQADNDFAALFRIISAAHDSYAREPLVFPFAVGASFFGPVVPAGGASLGWSANSLHWLSAAPHPLGGRLWFRRGSGSDNPFSRQGHQDWGRFLVERARELSPGGQLVVNMVEADERGSCGADHFLDALETILSELVSAKHLRNHEFERMSLRLFFRTEEEIRRPLEGDLEDRLRFAEYEHTVVADPLFTEFERTGDAAAFARAHVAWQRGFSEPSLFSVLDEDRGQEQRRALADAVYEELRKRVEARPARARCDWRFALLRIVRR